MPSFGGRESNLPYPSFPDGFGPLRRENGAPGEAQRSGFAGERRNSGMSEFSPFWAETREKVNCSAGAREAALGRMELVTTMSRRKP